MKKEELIQPMHSIMSGYILCFQQIVMISGGDKDVCCIRWKSHMR